MCGEIRRIEVKQHDDEMLRAVGSFKPLGIASHGWLLARNKVCLREGSNLEHYVSSIFRRQTRYVVTLSATESRNNTMTVWHVLYSLVLKFGFLINLEFIIVVATIKRAPANTYYLRLLLDYRWL